MFDISALKEMKLSELQEIAKAAKTIKFNGVKKEALISQILELQSATTDSTSGKKKVEDKVEDDKPKRARIIAPKKAAIQKSSNNSLFSEQEIGIESNYALNITSKFKFQKNFDLIIGSTQSFYTSRCMQWTVMIPMKIMATIPTTNPEL